jgi:hypothetical protein
MDYSQSVFPQHDSGNLVFAVPASNASLPGASLHFNQTFQAFQASYTMGQVAWLMIPSAVLLLLFPARAFQLRRASLKVLPNYMGAIKAVGSWERTRFVLW